MTNRLIVGAIVLFGLISCSTYMSGPPKMGYQYYSKHPTGEYHLALDLDGPIGTIVRAAGDGTVIATNNTHRYANVRIKNTKTGITTYYYHIGDIKVAKGDEVKRGQQIARLELTGVAGPQPNAPIINYPHLHFEVFKGDEMIDPETLKMTCPGGGGEYWWPIGCDEFYKK